MEKKVCPLKISIMIVARGINRPTAINTPVHYKIYKKYKPEVFFFFKSLCWMNLTFAAIYDYWIQIKSRNELSPFLHVKPSVAVRCPGKKCLLKNRSSFLPLPQFKSGTEISKRQTWNFLCSPSPQWGSPGFFQQDGEKQWLLEACFHELQWLSHTTLCNG